MQLERTEERIEGLGPVAWLEDDGIVMSLLDPEQGLPLMIQRAREDVDATQWAKAHADLIEQELLRRGALLFRGFPLGETGAFERFASVLSRDLFNENGEHPRESISGNVYTPVSYPSESQLLWHNENSFNHRWPRKIMFCCAQPAAQGGETPIVDSRKVYERLDPEIRRTFEEKGVMYVRNYGTGIGLDWPTVFGTDDRSAVERQCAETLTTAEWTSQGLRTRAVRPAVIRHPQTGEMSWFNQAQHWHPSCLEPAVRESLSYLFSDEDMPRNCFYGDGSVIGDSAMEAILDAYRELEVVFPWQTGDVMLVENILAAHGRNAYQGTRKLLVALGEMTAFTDLPR